MYAEISVLSLISAALALVPPIWYYQTRNIAAVAIGIWLSITSMIYAVDALVWAKSTDVEASVWCDISTVFITGSRVALPAACFSICVHLERLASFSATSTPRAKKQRILFECLMCFGLPIVYIALHLIVQPRRFDLFYGFGCRPVTYPTVATILLVTTPPVLLTFGTIFFACIAWRHFLVHGVQFYGKRGSVSSLTRNLYLRLVGMALLEAMLSAVLISFVMWGVLSPGLAPIESMPRRLGEVSTWGPDALTNTVRTVLEIEWSVTVVQSVVFFALFACRMEVLRRGQELIQPFLQFFYSVVPLRLKVKLGSSAESSTGDSVSEPTLPMTSVDLSLDIESARTLSPSVHSTNPKSLSSTLALDSLRRSSFLEDATENIVISALPTAMVPLESPSRASAIASSHNSLESNFDPSQLQFILPLETWPQTPTTPISVRLSRRPSSAGCVDELEKHSWIEVEEEGEVQFPLGDRVKPGVHDRSRRVSDAVLGKGTETGF